MIAPSTANQFMIQTLFGSLDEQQKPSFLERMKEAVTRTRESLSERMKRFRSAKKSTAIRWMSWKLR